MKSLVVLHAQQLCWNNWLRVGWWLILLPLALLCWSAARASSVARIAGFVLTAFAALVWSAGVAGAVNPTKPPPAQHSQVVVAPTRTPDRAALLAQQEASASAAAASAAAAVAASASAEAARVLASASAAAAAVLMPSPTPSPVPVAVAPAPAPVVTPSPTTHKAAVVAPAAPPVTKTATHTQAAACTHTSSGTCIHGGGFCPVASEGSLGTDAAGRRYTCTDSDHNGHPHWE